MALSLLALSGCGDHGRVAATESRPDAAAVCAAVSHDASLADYHVVEVAGTKSTTMARAKDWLATRGGSGGPVDTFARFAALDQNAAASSPITACVFRTGKNLPITTPPGNTTTFNGFSVLAQDAARFGIDGYGPVDRMVAELDSH
jgi:hypothetical protein